MGEILLYHQSGIDRRGETGQGVRRGTAGRIPPLGDGLLHRARISSTIDALLDLLAINPNDVALEEARSRVWAISVLHCSVGTSIVVLTHLPLFPVYTYPKSRRYQSSKPSHTKANLIYIYSTRCKETLSLYHRSKPSYPSHHIKSLAS